MATITPLSKRPKTDEGPVPHSIQLSHLGSLPDELIAEILSYVPFHDIPDIKIPTSTTIYGDGTPATITYLNPKTRALKLKFPKRLWLPVF